VPILEGKREGWSNEVFSQHDLDEFMLKRGNLKYLTFGEKGSDVLFDLASDPGESSNRISDTAYILEVTEMRERLQDFIASRCVLPESTCLAPRQAGPAATAC